MMQGLMRSSGLIILSGWGRKTGKIRLPFLTKVTGRSARTVRLRGSAFISGLASCLETRISFILLMLRCQHHSISSGPLLSNIDRNWTRECDFKRFGGRCRLLFEYHPPGRIRLKSDAMVNKNKSNRRPQRSRRVWARTARRLSLKRSLVKASSRRRRRSGLSLSQ